MKHIIATLAALALPAALQATEANDTTISYGGRQIIISDTLGRLSVSALDSTGAQLVKTQETTFVDGQEIERIYVSSPFIPSRNSRRKFTCHFPGLYLGHDVLTNGTLSFSDPTDLRMHNTKSYEIGVTGMEFAIPFNRQHTFGLTTGLQAGWVRHYLDNGFTLGSAADGTVVQQPISGGEVRKSYISYTYVRVPVLLEWQQKLQRHELFAGIGLSAEVRGSEHSRYKGSMGTITPCSNLNFNTFGLNMELQVGVDDVTFFLRSALTPLMQDGRGPKCYPLSIGIGLRL